MQPTFLITAVAAMTSMGCFSIQEVDVTGRAASPRVVLDDFDDGDLAPSTDLFDNWQCYQFNSEPRVPESSLVLRTDGNLAYSLSFDLTGPAVPSNNGIGAGMYLLRQAGTVDLRPYQRLHVSVKLDSGSPPLPAAARFEIGVVCTTVSRGSGSGTWLPAVVEEYSISDEFPTPDDWHSLTVSLHQLMPPAWLKTQEPNAGDCLKAVDFLHFELSSSFDVNQHASGTLAIDDVWLE
jgi:hypothetical protein